MQLFFSTDIQGDQIFLDETESKHCLQVLRKKTGDLVQVVDGQGNWYEGAIELASKKKCTVRITHTKALPVAPPGLHIAIAPVKNMSRIEWFLEKCTEFGIREISLIHSQFSEKKHINMDRLQKIIVTAMKQSLEAWLPKLNNIRTFDQFLADVADREAVKLIGHCWPGEKKLFREACQPAQDLIVLIGPEGDFSPVEVEAALEAGFEAIDLGNKRLRSETAGMAICCFFNLING